MYGLYRRYMSGLRDTANMTLMTHYSSVTPYGQSGSWGLMEWMDQQPATAPKLQVGSWADRGAEKEMRASGGSRYMSGWS